jgi:hypothetical protein
LGELEEMERSERDANAETSKRRPKTPEYRRNTPVCRRKTDLSIQISLTADSVVYVCRAGGGGGEGEGEGFPTSLLHVDPVKHVYKSEAAELDGRVPEITAAVKSAMHANENSMPQLTIALPHFDVTQAINSEETPPMPTLKSSRSSAS